MFLQYDWLRPAPPLPLPEPPELAPELDPLDAPPEDAPPLEGPPELEEDPEDPEDADAEPDEPLEVDVPDEPFEEPEDELVVVLVVVEAWALAVGDLVPPVGTVSPVGGLVPVPVPPPPPQAASASAVRIAAVNPAMLRAACPFRITLRTSQAAGAGPSADRSADSR